MRDRGLEPLHLLDLLGGHASSGGAHVLSGHDGPVRVLEAHIIKVRLLGAEAALELADLLLEAHAAAALLDRVFVESFALLRERHEFIRLRVTRRVDAARGDDESGRLGITRASPDAARGLCCQISPAAGAYLLVSEITIFSCPGYRRATLPLCPKSISG